MRRRLGIVMIGVALGLAALAPAALASGTNSGGSGSGGSGGGGTVTAPAPTSCATITGFSNSTGYYSIYAAIWTSFSISSTCASPANWQMTYTNGTTGVVDFSRGSTTAYMPSGTVDEDWAAFSTAYTVALTVTDSNGVVLASQSAVVTTKAPKTPGA